MAKIRFIFSTFQKIFKLCKLYKIIQIIQIIQLTITKQGDIEKNNTQTVISSTIPEVNLYSPKHVLKTAFECDLPLYNAPEPGLINDTYIVGAPPQFVLQWVNPIFSHLIHQDLDIITKHLISKDLTTPTLQALPNGDLCYPDEERGYWRLWTFIPGNTFHKMDSTKKAFCSGVGVGKFHQALSDLEYQFKAPPRGGHNTPEKIENLQKALQNNPKHDLYEEAAVLGSSILQNWEQWNGLLEEPQRICHGDLKISNLHFDDQGEVCALLDLDTVAKMAFSVEMGDAWRSWCNPAGEDDPSKVFFDVDIFESSVRGWLSQNIELTDGEKRYIPEGIERICLELSARFCADALQNNYFRENRTKFPQIGRHNLHRALGQFRLAQSVKKQRNQIFAIWNQLVEQTK
jgi:hypothetical protein